MDKDTFVIFAAEEDWQVNNIDEVYKRFKKDNIIEDIYKTHAFQYQYAESILNLSEGGFIQRADINSPFDSSEERARLVKGKNFLDYMETMIRHDQGEEQLKIMKLKVELLWGKLNNTQTIREIGASSN